MATGLPCGTVARAQTTELNFGIISTEASVNQKKNWEPFVDAMTKATGLKVNGFYASDYAGVIEAMRFNKVQVAWYGNKSGDGSGQPLQRRGVRADRRRATAVPVTIRTSSSTPTARTPSSTTS